MKKLELKQPDLTVVIPAYCEERRIGATLNGLAEFLGQDAYFKKIEVEVLVVAADAQDATHDIVRSKLPLFKRAQLLMPGLRVGKGRDVRYGMLRASGKYILFMDADLATPLHHLREFYEACRSDCDIAIGTRNLLVYRQDILRGVLAYIGNVLCCIVSGATVEDTQCGFKMFNANSAKLCFTRQTILGWGFDIEILAIASVNKLRIKTIRLNDWQHMPYSTYTSTMPTIAARTIRDLAVIAANRFLRAYNSVNDPILVTF